MNQFSERWLHGVFMCRGVDQKRLAKLLGVTQGRGWMRRVAQKDYSPGQVDAVVCFARSLGYRFHPTTHELEPVLKPRAKPSAGALAAFLGVDPLSDSFLQSYVWRKIRMEALKKYGTKCQCCGASPETGAVMNVDHVKPRQTHPGLALELSNLQVLCAECNHGKGNWDQTDWRR